jgi:hypothetical protein
MPGKAEQIDHAMDSDRVASLLSGVVDHQLPPVLDELVTEYQSLPDARPEFVWQWVHKLAPQNTLPCVDAANRERVLTDKTLIVLFVTLLDDALEKRRDEATFQTMASIPFVRRDEERSLNGVHIEDGGVSPPDSVGGDLSGRVDSKYVEFAQRVWEVLITRLEQSQRYDRYEDLFRFDLTQAVNAIQYSDLVIRHPEFGTLEELKRYESHNMGMLAYADVDLMYSSDVPDSLALLRKGVEHGQQMARIGNWVSTWRRELVEGDYRFGGGGLRGRTQHRDRRRTPGVCVCHGSRCRGLGHLRRPHQTNRGGGSQRHAPGTVERKSSVAPGGRRGTVVDGSNAVHRRD